MDKINEDGYRVTDTHVFFYKKWLSNFGKCKFKWTYPYKLDGVSPYDIECTRNQEFFCTEQAFMWAKAVHFHDFDCAGKIINEKDSPMKCKDLGRQVKNYDDNEWERVRYDVMKSVNFSKYSQDKDLARKLLHPDFYGKTFVEASPIDGIWGVKMDLNDDRIVDPANWRGRNLLGQAITEVRRMMELGGMATVKDLIDHLGTLDPNSYILTAEMNALNGGMWQHVPKDMLDKYVKTVSNEKDEHSKIDPAYVEREFIYTEDNDVIVRF